MRLSLTTGTYAKTPLPQALKNLKGYGYSAIELTAIPAPYQGHVELTKTPWREIRDLKRVLAELDMGVSAVNSGPLPPYPTSAQKDYVLLAVEMAAELSSKVAITYVTKNPATSGKSPQEWRPALVEVFRQCARHAQQYGVYLTLETEPGFEISDPYTGIAFIREVGHSHFKYNLCVPHVLPTIPPSQDIHSVMDAAKDLIVNTHLSDVKNRVHKHLLPGEGEVDFRRLVEHLERIGYGGYLTFDLYPFVDRPDYAASKTAEAMKELLG